MSWESGIVFKVAKCCSREYMTSDTLWVSCHRQKPSLLATFPAPGIAILTLLPHFQHSQQISSQKVPTT